MDCCSFCNSLSHNVNYCKEVSLLCSNIEELYMSCLRLVHSKIKFMNVVLERFSFREIQFICIKLGLTASSSKMHTIKMLYKKIKTNLTRSIIPIFDLSDETIVDKAEECAICFDSITCTNQVILNCSHQFCGVCINDCLGKSTGELSCALCRTPIKSIISKNIDIYSAIDKTCNKINKTT